MCCCAVRDLASTLSDCCRYLHYQLCRTSSHRTVLFVCMQWHNRTESEKMCRLNDVLTTVLYKVFVLHVPSMDCLAIDLRDAMYGCMIFIPSSADAICTIAFSSASCFRRSEFPTESVKEGCIVGITLVTLTVNSGCDWLTFDKSQLRADRLVLIPCKLDLALQ